MQTVSTIRDVRSAVIAARRAGKSVGLVPTMGALHAGHLSLVETSRQECDFTVVSIFVNPTQFAPTEDLAKYPRPLDADLQKLADHGVDLVFLPADGEMYADNYSTFVDVGPIGGRLEGKFRPTHFRGVATVVLKLFNIVTPDKTFFGQKDFQQTLVIRKLITELNVPVELRVCPTVREPDGLAMSSRNAYLKADDRRRAIGLSESLQVAEQLVASGERNATVILERMYATLAAAGIDTIDYVVLANPDTLDDVKTISGPTVAAIAVRVGSTRLIDNAVLLSR